MKKLIKEILLWYQRPYSGIEVDLDEKEVIVFTDSVEADHTRPVDIGEFTFTVNFVKAKDDKNIHDHMDEILDFVTDTTRYLSVGDDICIEDEILGYRHKDINLTKGGTEDV